MNKIIDVGYRFECSNFVHISLPVKCDLSVYTFSEPSLEILVDFQEGPNVTYALKQTSIKFNKAYNSTGTFLITVYIPSKGLTFNQTVIIHGKQGNLYFANFFT
jgi:hypothetical protein